MEKAQYDFGMVGLGVMGRNFLLNVADQGYAVIGMDRDTAKADALEIEAGTKKAKGTTSTETFVGLLKKPRAIMLLVPAGKIVDQVIDSLLPFLDSGDLLIDGGNSHFSDTDRRLEYLQEKGIHFLGVGVSGGSKGARFGPSIMPGGNRDAYRIIAPVFEKVAAKVGADTCVAYMGNGSAGHYVKMVHNGIEYALMQLIAESYDLLNKIAGLSNRELAETYSSWNASKLQSFLIEITATIFRREDDISQGDLIDHILDKAKQKGTGKWTSQNAMDHGIPVPTIDAAVTMRGISALKAEREQAARILDHQQEILQTRSAAFVDQVKDALLFATIISYAQGLRLLQEVSEEKGYELELGNIAKIWRGGCIIRAALLEDIRQAYQLDPKLKNLLVSPVFSKRLLQIQQSCRIVIKTAIDTGIPILAFSGALHYFDAYRSARLPLNLTQAQRDYFGSHTYERVDRQGIFHTDWP